MTLLEGIFGARASAENPTVPLTSSTLLELVGGAKTAAGVPVSERSSLGLPSVWRAVNLIAGTGASLPLHAFRADDGGQRTRVTSGRAADLLDSPHPDMTAFEFWEIAWSHLLLWGNAYLRILRGGLGQILELWLVHPSRVKAGRVTETGRKIYVVDGTEVHYDDTMLHIPGFGYDGVCGLSPVRAARQGLSLALAAEEYGARLFGSGSLATGILQTEQRLTSQQADAISARWKAKRAGLGSAHETMILDSGAKFHQLTIPPEDAQFLQSRSFQVSEVARMFGVPPHMLMDTDKSTSWGTGIEQQSIGFVVYTLRPWLTRIEQRVTRLLRPQAVYARYAVEGLLRGDSTQRAAFYKSMWEIGVFSTNDILALEERAPVEHGDVRYRPLNMGELGSTDQPSNEGASDAPASS